jgi:hypothetical protein
MKLVGPLGLKTVSKGSREHELHSIPAAMGVEIESMSSSMYHKGILAHGMAHVPELV